MSRIKPALRTPSGERVSTRAPAGSADTLAAAGLHKPQNIRDIRYIYKYIVIL